ncbi:hypothetical protein MTW97_01655 [Mammaliicoccus sciuri]|uniref:hypothetical protein n=1 Tax=Mammaliicoccus sciuri TaxID=1296 RepID=UPI001FB33E73|nr:hypothetical protein [Mammaliicoccus sciuri]MCJ0921349.1 hypothetical protein [Mammaliicoccus sciuri]
MKIKDIAKWTTITIGAIVFVSKVGNCLSNIDPNNKLEGYTIAISFVGLFATFYGAYLGAKISGDKTRELYESQKEDRIKEKNDKIKLLLKMNLYSMNNLRRFICEYFFIEEKSFSVSFKKERNNLYKEHNEAIKKGNQTKAIIFLTKYIKKTSNKIVWDASIHDDINTFINLCNEINSEMIFFDEKQLNTIYQLKQVLIKLKPYIVLTEENQTYTIKIENEEEFDKFKAWFMLFNVLYIDLCEEILDVKIGTEE